MDVGPVTTTYWEQRDLLRSYRINVHPYNVLSGVKFKHEESCPVCMSDSPLTGPGPERTYNLTPMAVTHCGHLFHAHCLATWCHDMSPNDEEHPVPCPCCRQQINYMPAGVIPPRYFEPYTPDVSTIVNVLNLVREGAASLLGKDGFSLIEMTTQPADLGSLAQEILTRACRRFNPRNTGAYQNPLELARASQDREQCQQLLRGGRPILPALLMAVIQHWLRHGSQADIRWVWNRAWPVQPTTPATTNSQAAAPQTQHHEWPVQPAIPATTNSQAAAPQTQHRIPRSIGTTNSEPEASRPQLTLPQRVTLMQLIRQHAAVVAGNRT